MLTSRGSSRSGTLPRPPTPSGAGAVDTVVAGLPTGRRQTANETFHHLPRGAPPHERPTAEPPPWHALAQQAIELPSWAFGNSGTRFKVFAQPGVPATRSRRSRTPRRCTGSPGSRRGSRCTSRGTWSTTSARSPRTPRTSGVALGTINSNTFQDDDYRLGSLTHADAGGAAQGDRPPPRVHRHHGRRPARRDLKIWLADGTNYPGQDDMRGRQDRLADSLQQIYARLGDGPAAGAGVQVLRAGVLPHRRPGLGHLATCTASRSATRRWSCLDTGHHAPGTNIEFIVMQLLRAGQARRVRLQLALLRRRRPDRRRGRPVPAVPDHARGRRAAAGSARSPAWRSCSTSATTSRPKIPGQIRSVLNVQEVTAKALLVDRDALAAAQRAGRRAGRERRLDGRLQHRRPRRCSPSCASRGACPPTRCAAYAASGYQERIAAERVGGTQAGWGA